MEPRGAQDDVSRVHRSNGLLAGELAPAIGVDRRRPVLLHIGSTLVAIEDIVRRDVDQRNAPARRLGGQTRRRLGIERKSSRLFAFRPVDLRECSRVDDHVPRPCPDHSREPEPVEKLECGTIGSEHVDCAPRRERLESFADLAGAAKNEDLHSGSGSAWRIRVGRRHVERRRENESQPQTSSLSIAVFALQGAPKMPERRARRTMC